MIPSRPFGPYLSWLLCGVALALGCRTMAQAPSTVPGGTQLAPPTAFPAPGVYTNTTGISLLASEPGAEIRYTLDGSDPTPTSVVFDQRQVLFLAGVYDGDRGLKTGYTIRAIALKPGHPPSDPATFVYQMERRDRTAYVSEIVAPGIRMIRDSNNDKIFLIEGRDAFALVDSGMGRGDLKAYVGQFTGGRPLYALFTHSHGDHIGQASQFIDSTLHIGAGDRPGLVNSLRQRSVPDEQIERNVRALNGGEVFDLGGRTLTVFATPGHTAGSSVFLDSQTGALFTGDSVGNNSPLPPDVMWMQASRQPLDEYFATIRAVRRELGDRVKVIMTGHNDRPLEGTQYLDNLETALQNMMDRGDAALIPSVRPPNIVQTVVGDRMTDPNWFGVNVNRQTYLPAPVDQIASLIEMTVTGAQVEGRISPRQKEYVAEVTPGAAVTVAVRPASSRTKGISIDGRNAAPNEAVAVTLDAPFRVIPIVITAPDGQTTERYQLTLRVATR